MNRTVEAVALYRAILRLGRSQLKLTDQDFFKRVVRSEFRKHECSPNELDFQLEVAKHYTCIIMVP